MSVADRGAPTAHFVSLDGMRGIAALAVLSAHAAMLFTHTPRHYYLAVDFFFLLSGFVLAHAYQARLDSGLSPAAFLRLRLARIYPLYALAMVLGFIHAVCARHGDEGAPLPAQLGRLGLGLLMLPAPGLSTVRWLFPLDIPAWSLLFELLANLLFALLHGPLRRSPWLLAGVIAGSGAALLGCGLVYGHFDIGATSDDAVAGLPRVLFSFLLGVALYRIWRLYPLRRAVPWWPPLLLLAAALLLHLPNAKADLYLQFALIGGLFPLLVYCGAATRPGRVAARVFGWLGTASYGVYVLHEPLFFMLRDVGAYFGQPPSQWAPWSGVAYVAALIALCLLLDRTFDRPLRRRLQPAREGKAVSGKSLPAAGVA
jgi:peptidoglycan/LPS O-acetylase OafA/YrhL